MYNGPTPSCDGYKIPGSPYCLIYNNPDCMWHSKLNEYGWLIFEMNSKLMTITGYRIYSTSSICCTLKRHYLKGSNDGINWEEIVHITTNTPADYLQKWATYNVRESTYRMFKIEEEQNDLGPSCDPGEKYFGLQKVDFYVTKISDINKINDNKCLLKCSFSCSHINIFCLSLS